MRVYMHYRRCRCGRCEQWATSETVPACLGCAECGATLATTMLGHHPLQPHDWEPYTLADQTPRRCRRCGAIDNLSSDEAREAT